MNGMKENLHSGQNSRSACGHTFYWEEKKLLNVQLYIVDQGLGRNITENLVTKTFGEDVHGYTFP